MTDAALLSAAELAEIERKVAAFREVVTRAAIRRHILRSYAPKREARAALDQPRVQISIMERLLAGERYKVLAAEYHYSAAWLAGHIRDVVRDQMQYIDDDNSCEWYRCLRARGTDYRAVWLPLALARLRADLVSPSLAAAGD